jgi:DNA-binding GntR family transcriptional regulator
MLMASTDRNALATEDNSLRIQRKSSTLREKAADMLRQAIIDHRFPPGTHLIERELCELLGVSRTSVREALRHLESEQLIQMVPHKGPIVASLTTQDAQDLYQVRASLEGLAGELFALRATDKQIDALCKTTRKMASIPNTKNPMPILKVVEQFYQIIFDGAQNPVCTQFVQSLNTRISVLRRMSLASEGRHSIMMDEVNEIMDAAAARDPDKLKQACIAHVEGACQAALSQLKKNEEKEPPNPQITS